MKRDFLSAYLALAALLVVSHGPSFAQSSLPATHPKSRTASRVYADLVRTVGDGRTPPSLRLLPRTSRTVRKVAWLLPKHHEIVLEERAYDLCTSLGADSLDALSFLLGHEIAHWYKGHGLILHFGASFADLGAGQFLPAKLTPKRQAEMEFKADYFGGFSGALAGYQSLAIAPTLLERIHQEYDLADELPGYPSLSVRQQTARLALEKLQHKVPIFEAGTALLLLRHFGEAAHCFDHIQINFPSREIINNAGVARALEALRYFQPGTVPFVYPFEVDASTRLATGSKALQQLEIFQPDDELRRHLLEAARDKFEEARRKDGTYIPAYINLASTADLLGEKEEAQVWAQKALRLAQEQGESLSLANALIVRGIVRSEEDTTLARQDFLQAQKTNPDLADANLKALEAGLLDNEPPPNEPPLLTGEKMAGLSARDYEDILAGATVVNLPRLGERPALTIYSQQTPSWEGLVINTGRSVVALRSTPPQYSGQTERGIKLGETLQAIHNAYGRASYLMAGRQGTYHVYSSAGIIFHIGANNRLRQWMLYTVEQ